LYGEGLLAPRPTLKLEDHPSSAVRGCLFNLFIATLLTGGRSSIRNPRTRHAVVTGTHNHACLKLLLENLSTKSNMNNICSRHSEPCTQIAHIGNLKIWVTHHNGKHSKELVWPQKTWYQRMSC